MTAHVQPVVGSALQHPVVGVVNTPLPVGPLRLDSIDGPPSSGKMVSLADLHINTTPAATLRTIDVQAVDPFDPLLQHLVQDKQFSGAVQTSQLHAAAAAAVKVFRTTGPQSGDFKRPADRHFYHHHNNNNNNTGNGGGGPFRGGTQKYQYTPMSMGAGVRSMKQEVLQLEEAIPWTMVRKNWRNKRTSWRRQVKQTELVADFAVRLKELRLALLAEDHDFFGCGPSWRNHLEACAQGRGSAAALMSVWDELKITIRSWLSGASPGGGGGVSGGGGGFTSPPGPAPSSASTGRAVVAMQAAVKSSTGNTTTTNLDDTDSLLQAPLESIMGHDGSSLHAVRQAIELERRVVSARLAAVQGGGGGEQTRSYFNSIAAGWEDSDFDSGVETDMDQGSDATDLDSDFDA